MKAIIKTEKLKDLLAKAVKGASNNKLLPITGFVRIAINDGVIRLATTDMVSHLYLKDTVESGDTFKVVVGIEKFSKLISKMTCENIELEKVEDKAFSYLKVTGNGTYKIEIPLDENGNEVEFPAIQYTVGDKAQIKKSVIDLILATCKPSLAKTLEVPVYTNYYVGSNVLATDTMQIAAINVELVKDKKMLISSNLMDLLSVLDKELVDVQFDASGKIVDFSTDDVRIISRVENGIEDYAVDAINQLVAQEFESSCKFNKLSMANTLERIALFVGPYDDRAVSLTFTENGINVASKEVTGFETIAYVEDTNYKSFTCMINIDMLLAQLKASSADIIEMQYGAENGIKLVDGAVTQVIALLEA